MATLVLGIAGSAIGGALLPGGLSLLGATLSGAAVGSTLATIGGAFIDQALLGPLTSATGQASVPQGPRVTDLKLGTSSEGTPLAARLRQGAAGGPADLGDALQGEEGRISNSGNEAG